MTESHGQVPGRADPRLTTGVLGGLLLTLGAPLAWIDSPVRGRITSGPEPLAILVAGLALVACVRGWIRLSIAAGTVALALCAFVLVRLAVGDPLLWSLANDNAQYSEIVRFSRGNMPWNLGSDPQQVHDVSTDTLSDRLGAALYFMATGWWLYLVGGLVVLLGCARARPLETVGWAALFGAGAAGAGVVVLFGPLAAEVQAARADHDMAYAQFTEAIHNYEAAQRHSSQAEVSNRIWSRIGEAYYRLNMTTDVRARFYLAERYSTAELDQAITEYLLLADGNAEPPRSLARRRLAWIYAKRGLSLYSDRSAATAVAWWEKSLAMDPAQVQAAFFLSRGYFDVGQYENSITMGRRVLSQAGDARIRADTLCNIGDSFTRLHQLTAAREAYERSGKLDPELNFRMFRSLGGT